MTARRWREVRKLLVFIAAAAGALVSTGLLSGDELVWVNALILTLGGIGVHQVPNATPD